MSTKAAQRDARREVVQTSRTKGERVTFFTSPKGATWWTDTYTARPAREALTDQLETFELPVTVDVLVGRITAPYPTDSAHPKPGAIARATELVIRRVAGDPDLVRLRYAGKRLDNGAGHEVVELRGKGERELLDARDDDLLAMRLMAERDRLVAGRPAPLLATEGGEVKGLAMSVLEIETSEETV